MVVDAIRLVKSRKLMKVSFDPGSTKILIKASAVLKIVKSVPMKSVKKINTIAGSMNTQELIRLKGLRLPQFDKKMSN